MQTQFKDLLEPRDAEELVWRLVFCLGQERSTYSPNSTKLNISLGDIVIIRV